MLHVIFPPRSISFLFWTAVLLNVADIQLTIAILNAGGTEANPYVNLFIEMFGYAGLWLVKIIPFGILAFALFWHWNELSPKFQTFTKRILVAVNIAYTVLVFYSLHGVYTTYLGS